MLRGELLDGVHEAFFVHADEADGLAAGASAPGAPDAVHVVFGDVGNVKVDDVGQVADVDAARGDVGGDEGDEAAALEVGERLRARGLAFVAVQRHGADAVLDKVVGDAVGAEFGAREDEYLVPALLDDEVHEGFFLALSAHGVDDLRDALHGGVGRGDLHALRRIQHAGGKAPNVVGEGGGKEQALALGGQEGEHFFHVVNEAHVEHAVGFVEHEDFYGGQVNVPLPDEVEQPPGGGDEDVHARLHALNLRRHAHAAEDDGGGELQVAPVVLRRFLHLRGQLARGGEHQRAYGAGALGFALREQLQHGQHERGGFARAGLRASEQVAAVKHERNGLLLNRSGGAVALFAHGLKNGGRQLQFFKCHGLERPKKALQGAARRWPLSGAGPASCSRPQGRVA